MKTTRSTKAAVLEDAETSEVEVATKAVINEAIGRVADSTGIDVQKDRYKAMRAIAFEAFAQAIDAGTFDALVESAIANIGVLPTGWEIERTVTDKSAKAPVKPAVRRRPTP